VNHDLPPLKIKVPYSKPCRFSHSQPRRIDKLKKGPVPQTKRRGRIDLLQKRLHLCLGKGPSFKAPVRGHIQIKTVKGIFVYIPSAVQSRKCLSYRQKPSIDGSPAQKSSRYPGTGTHTLVTDIQVVCHEFCLSYHLYIGEVSGFQPEKEHFDILFYFLPVTPGCPIPFQFRVYHVYCQFSYRVNGHMLPAVNDGRQDLLSNLPYLHGHRSESFPVFRGLKLPEYDECHSLRVKGAFPENGGTHGL